jgi:TPP-dependent pyruvate/acetoin dehydrogenase alpha subunit
MKYATKKELIDFEQTVAQHWEAGDLPYLIHLSGGNEDFLIDLFNEEIKDGDWIFSTHRNHHHALLSGIPRNELLAKILAGNSMFVFDSNRHFYTSSVLAGTCAIAAGVAYTLKQSGSENWVYCFVGDGAQEQGHFYEAVMFVEAHDLPCMFVIEDNDRSVDSSLEERNPTKWRFEDPSCVMRDEYTPTYPHAGNGTKKHIIFKDVK